MLASVHDGFEFRVKSDVFVFVRICIVPEDIANCRTFPAKNPQILNNF
jgi:hypothetical protein